MKIKTTKRAIKENYNLIISIGYCNLQSLLKYFQPFAYSTRTEGWACDYYNVEGVIISTGYSPIGISVDYELVNKYEKEGMKLRYSNSTWAEKKERAMELLNEFIKEALNKPQMKSI
jgi:hypothetical protein